MQRTIDRRTAIKGVGTAAIFGIAGCTEFGSGTAPGDNTQDDGAESGDDSQSLGNASGDESSPTFEYTFESDDDVVESSLTGIRVNYPDESGAVSDASVASVTLGGGDVNDDLDGTSTLNNGSSLRLDFGGSYDIEVGGVVALDLSSVSAPDYSYTVEIVVNPQSGATAFDESF